MKERPIIFGAPMVRAILSGSKSQTRRVVKPQPERSGDGVLMWGASHRGMRFGVEGMDVPPGVLVRCPYGIGGDRLYVRETWMPDAPRDGTWAGVAFFGCKGSPLSMIPAQYRTPEHVIHRASWDGHDMVGWKPSIHMPRWASRITLEVTGVRVERLQDISIADALAEGVDVHKDHWAKNRNHICSPVQAFADLWKSINGPDSWDANPWVWAIEFKRITP